MFRLLEAIFRLDIKQYIYNKAVKWTRSRLNYFLNYFKFIPCMLKNTLFLYTNVCKNKYSKLADRVILVKTLAGILGNETADKLTKDAARSRLIDITFSRIPISSVYYDIQIDSIKRWQKEWQNCTKALTTKQFFPSVEEKLKKKLESLRTWQRC